MTNSVSNKLDHLNKKIATWAKHKGILDNGNPIAQAEKTLEECLELIEAVGRYKYLMDIRESLSDDDYCLLLDAAQEEIRDAIGDIHVTIVIQALLQGEDYTKCVEDVYNIINKRTGKMVNGKFVKDQ